MKNRKLSVGKIGASINIIIYAICGVIYGLPTMIYSIIYAVISSIIIDNTHEQNICSYVIIFTKNKQDKIIEFIKGELNRDATFWDGYGGYKKEKVHIIINMVDNLCHEIVYHKHPQINYDIMKNEVVAVIRNILA